MRQPLFRFALCVVALGIAGLDHGSVPFLGLTVCDNISVNVSCFNFGDTPKAKIYPKVIYNEKGIKLESLIDQSNTDCFVINRLTLENAEYLLNINDGYGVYIVTNGEGKLYSKEGYLKQINKGDYFFMPACLMGKFSIEGNIEVIECY